MPRNSITQTLHLLDRIARMTVTDSHSGGLKPAQWDTLRYLDRANRFSRTPGALTAYLNVTKGTVSQTVRSLEQRKLVSKKSGKGDKRTVRLSLTAPGRKQLARDPMAQMEVALEHMPKKAVQKLADGMQSLLDSRVHLGGGRRFGTCADCRHFARNKNADPPNRCLLFDEALSQPDLSLICAMHERREKRK